MNLNRPQTTNQPIKRNKDILFMEKTEKITILSTRFNEKTWNENKDYREKQKVACIYGSPKPISDKIMVDSLLVMVEMNNSLNQIEGAGLIRNRPKINKRVYEIGNYNRYTYQGKYHLSRSKIIEHNPSLVERLDAILFKGKTHMKRGSGFTKIPDKLLYQERIEVGYAKSMPDSNLSDKLVEKSNGRIFEFFNGVNDKCIKDRNCEEKNIKEEILELFKQFYRIEKEEPDSIIPLL